jgi:hypothetical protein
VWHKLASYLHWPIKSKQNFRVWIVVWPKKLAPCILSHEVGPGCYDRKMFVAGWSLRGPLLPPDGTSWSWYTFGENIGTRWDSQGKTLQDETYNLWGGNHEYKMRKKVGKKIPALNSFSILGLGSTIFKQFQGNSSAICGVLDLNMYLAPRVI